MSANTAYRRSPPSSYPSPASPSSTTMPPRSPSIRYSPSDLADLEENFPPSISQRHPPRSPLRQAQTIDMRGYTHRSVSEGSARAGGEAQRSVSPPSAVRSGQDPPRTGEASRSTGQRSGPGTGSGALLLPNQSEPRVLKQKRSFERTKAWAAGLDASEMVDSEGAGSLTSDDACESHRTCPATPHCLRIRQNSQLCKTRLTSSTWQ